ncbi:hypothetical protein GEOBC_01965 [Geobacteraceae bacterium]|nr:hypothetical protein GEOBC_01965 [Geobacteraceae bacterium]
MRRNRRLHSAALAGLLAVVLVSTASASEPSGCVTCHLDKAMIIKNLSADTAKKSAMQSGAG